MIWKASVENFDALDTSEPYDVCIVGSGFSGTTLAKVLVEGGIRVLMLESGCGLSHWLVDRRLHQLAAYGFTGDIDYPLVRTKARVLGGNSNFWTGRSERFHPSDFEPHPYTPKENPWPIRYNDLEPFYVRAERLLRVRGNDFSEHVPPRSAPLLLPPRTDISSLRALMASIGVTVDESATATPRKALRFFRVNNEILPAFRNAPNLALVTGATVCKLLADESGRITGAQVRTLDGGEKIACAKTYVVAGGGIESPRLLLLSRSERFPTGIGNAHDRVGRGFNEHPSVNFYAKISHRKGTFFPRHKIARSHQFYDRFRAEGLGSLLFNVIQSYVFPNHLLKLNLKEVPGRLADIASRIKRPALYMGTTIEMKISDDNRVTLSENLTDPFGLPLAHLTFNYASEDLLLLERSRDLVLDIYRRLGATHIREANINFSRHHQGTCRMGDNPRTSVVDKDLRVHDTPNLYVCGAENFVTGAAVPPTLTLCALACRLGDHLLDVIRSANRSR